MSTSPTAKPEVVEDDIPVEVIDAPNALKAKLTGGLVNISLTVDEELLARAEAKVESLANDYLNWVEDDLVKLEQAHADLAKDPRIGSPAHEAIISGAFDIASQGSTFGFQMLTAVGDALHKYAGALAAIDQTHITVMKLHMDAMRVVLRHGLRGAGGEQGAELLQMLRTAATKTA